MLRTPARYTFSNPNTGFPFVLKLEGRTPAVRLAPSVLAIERPRDREDAACLCGRVERCATLAEAAALLAALDCTDLDADFDPATPDEQGRIDGVVMLETALSDLLEAEYLFPDINHRRDRLIRELKALITFYTEG